MLCRLHTVYKIIHCAALHTLCDITQRVSNYYTEKCQLFTLNLERKKLHRAQALRLVGSLNEMASKEMRRLNVQVDGKKETVYALLRTQRCSLTRILLLEKNVDWI